MLTDNELEVELDEFAVSYKPQKISPKFEGTVRELLHKRIRDAVLHTGFQVSRCVWTEENLGGAAPALRAGFSHVLGGREAEPGV